MEGIHVDRDCLHGEDDNMHGECPYVGVSTYMGDSKDVGAF